MAEYDPNQELRDQIKIELKKFDVDLKNPEKSGERTAKPEEKETA